MDCPAILWSGSRRSIPELRLEDLSTWGVETTEVLHDSGVVAAQLSIGASLGILAHNASSIAEDDLRTTKRNLAESPERRHGC
jgi:hypothetical protein